MKYHCYFSHSNSACLWDDNSSDSFFKFLCAPWVPWGLTLVLYHSLCVSVGVGDLPAAHPRSMDCCTKCLLWSITAVLIKLQPVQHPSLWNWGKNYSKLFNDVETLRVWWSSVIHTWCNSITISCMLPRVISLVPSLKNNQPIQPCYIMLLDVPAISWMDTYLLPDHEHIIRMDDFSWVWN